MVFDITLGVAIGMIISLFIFIFFIRGKNTIGNLMVVDEYDGDKPYIFLELIDDPKNLSDGGYVYLRVKRTKERAPQQ